MNINTGGMGPSRIPGWAGGSNPMGPQTGPLHATRPQGPANSPAQVIDRLTQSISQTRTQRDQLEASLGQAAPHEWPAIYNQLRELDRDISSQGRMLNQARELAGTGAGPEVWNRFNAWAVRGQRASPDNQVQLEFQVEQLVREAKGLPQPEGQQPAFQALANHTGELVARIRDLQTHLDGSTDPVERQQIELQLSSLETYRGILNDARKELNGLANDPAQNPAAWGLMAERIDALGAAGAQGELGRAQQLSGLITAAARQDARPGERVQEVPIYLALGDKKGQLSEELAVLRRELTNATGPRADRARQRVAEVEQSLALLNRFEAAVDRLEQSGAGGTAWERLDVLTKQLSNLDTARLEQAVRQANMIVDAALPQPR